MSENVKVIKLGLGQVVSNWGRHNGVPAVFIEPVIGGPGAIGATLSGDRETQIKNDSISDGGVVIEIHDIRGLHVLLEDFASAVKPFDVTTKNI